MKRARVLGLVLLFAFSGVASTQETVADSDTMTYDEAKSRIPARELPGFWVGSVDGLSGRFETLERGQVKTIATTPGGRPVYLVTFGERESVQHLANFSSAVGAGEPAAYMDKAARQRPVILLVGPVHGHEVEGLTGLVNLIHVMETGQDLRGRDQGRLRALGERCRLLIIPAGNPDGIARFEPGALVDMAVKDVEFWGQGTWSDGTLCRWPGVKRVHPMVGPRAGFVGCYFDDAGVNPMLDEFFAPMSSEAPAILKVATDEGPDMAVSLHSHSNPPRLLRPAYVTTKSQERVRALAERCYALLEARGLPTGTLFKVGPDGGEKPAAFSLVSALYHVSGADAFTFECPHGLAEERACHVTLDQILDIQFTLYETMMESALR